MMKRLWMLLCWPLKWLLLLPILFYRQFITPFTPPSCRFTPTCSEYAREAIMKHGPFKGLWLAVWRILRCNPWGGSGYDPVPRCEIVFCPTFLCSMKIKCYLCTL